MEMNIAEIFEKSPLFAKGIWFLLLGMSFWSLTVATGKWWGLRKAQKETPPVRAFREWLMGEIAETNKRYAQVTGQKPATIAAKAASS